LAVWFENWGRSKLLPESEVIKSGLSKKLSDNIKLLIVHEACDQFTKKIYPLVLRLIKDDEWTLIHLDGKMLIFVRNNEEYSDIINKYRLPKSLIYDEIILETLPFVSSGPAISSPYSSLSLAYVMKGEDKKARKMIDAALDLEKNDLVVISAWLILP
jgi:hypothetical protein